MIFDELWRFSTSFDVIRRVLVILDEFWRFPRSFDEIRRALVIFDGFWWNSVLMKLPTFFENIPIAIISTMVVESVSFHFHSRLNKTNSSSFSGPLRLTSQVNYKRTPDTACERQTSGSCKRFWYIARISWQMKNDRSVSVWLLFQCNQRQTKQFSVTLFVAKFNFCQ